MKYTTLGIPLVISVLLWIAFYLLKSIMMPFIIAVILAYLLDPILTTLCKLRVPRNIATLIVLMLFFTAIAMLTIMTMPIIYAQAMKLRELLLHSESQLSLPLVIGNIEHFAPHLIEQIKESIGGFSLHVMSFAARLLQEIFQSSMIAINILSLVFITPIVTFYILRDWSYITENFKWFIPKKFRSIVYKFLGDLDFTLSGYLRGQLLVCLVLSAYYSATLSMIGLDSALTIGILTGMLAFIPYIGATFGALLSILVAAIQFQTLKYMLFVLLIFALGQVLEGNFITPRLIGEKVGLHPVWIMFGLLACGTLFGFFGILIAVPLTAIIGVFTRLMISRYTHSKFYTNP